MKRMPFSLSDVSKRYLRCYRSPDVGGSSEACTFQWPEEHQQGAGAVKTGVAKE